MNKKMKVPSHILFTLVLALISVSLLMCVDLKDVHAIPGPVFGPVDHTYNMAIGNQSYTIKYGFSVANTVVQKMDADPSSNSITVVVDDNSTAQEQKFFFIELPRNVINSNSTEIDLGCSSAGGQDSWIQNHDKPYKVAVTSLSNGNTTVFDQAGELCDRDTRTLSIVYPVGKSLITIQGTTMIPEFPLPLEVLVMTISVAGVIGTSVAVNRRI